MSETGATEDQLLDAAQRLCGGQPEDVGYCWPDSELREFAAALVPSGYQIVPAGAVTLSAEEAAVLRHSLEYVELRRVLSYESVTPDESWLDLADRANDAMEQVTAMDGHRVLRALAAKLSGGAS